MASIFLGEKSKYMVYDQHPSVVIVYGTGPHNVYDDWLGHKHTNYFVKEIILRKKIAQEVILEVNPKIVIFVGGQYWANDGIPISEAAYMRDIVLANFKLAPNCRLLLAEDGLETIEQVEETINILHHHHYIPGNIHVISSWHQLLRISLLFVILQHTIIIPHFAEERISFSKLIIEEIINGIGGCLYILVWFFMQHFGKWQDGGPFIRKCRTQRKLENTMVTRNFSIQ